MTMRWSARPSTVVPRRSDSPPWTVSADSDSSTLALGMLVHEASVLAVILNGMRLLRY